MKRPLLLLVFGILPSLLHGAAVPNSTRKATIPLWVMDNTQLWQYTSDLFKKMESFAEFCCVQRATTQAEEAKCADQQLSYWFWAKNGDNLKDRLDSRDFNPEKANSQTMEWMCGIKPPLPLETHEYPKFDMQRGDSDTHHTEAKLLEQIKRKAGKDPTA